MISIRNRSYVFVGAILLLVLALGIGSVLAQTADSDEVVPEDAPLVEDDAPAVAFPPMRPSHAPDRMNDEAQLLADALGITVEELTAAQATARELAIAQAVADGLLTQEQADALLAGQPLRHMPMPLERDGTLLAEALGISPEALQAAMDEVKAARLSAMVEAGVITQEQADMATAQAAVQSYLDREALAEMMQEAYATAVADALADGAITQEQADSLLENGFRFPPQGQGFDGPRGRGGHGGHGGHSSHAPHHPGSFNNSSTTPDLAPTTLDNADNA